MGESKRTVVVTGSSGFIGRHLVRHLLDRGALVWGIDRTPSGVELQGFTERPVDVLDRRRLCEALAEASPESLIHLAARTDLDQASDIRGYAANIVGVENLIAAIAGTPSVRRWVCTSSQLVCRVGYVPRHDEDYQPNTLYGESKVRTEQIVRASVGAGREWCLTRPTTIWGPGMNPHYQRFFRMICRGTYVHVGRGSILKSYGYVGNTVAQYARLLDAPAESVHGRLFFLADYEPIDLRVWADAFQAALGSPPIRTIPVAVARAVARVGDIITLLGAKRFPLTSFRLNNVLTAYRADLAPTRAICGDLPYTMAEGVEATARWLRVVLNAAPTHGAGTA